MIILPQSIQISEIVLAVSGLIGAIFWIQHFAAAIHTYRTAKRISAPHGQRIVADLNVWITGSFMLTEIGFALIGGLFMLVRLSVSDVFRASIAGVSITITMLLVITSLKWHRTDDQIGKLVRRS